VTGSAVIHSRTRASLGSNPSQLAASVWALTLLLVIWTLAPLPLWFLAGVAHGATCGGG